MTLLKEINKLGSLMVSYSLLKSFGLQDAVILSRLITEYNYAVKHGNIANGYFLIDVDELADSVGLEHNQVIETLESLRDDSFIDITKAYYKGRYTIGIYFDVLSEYVHEMEYEYDYTVWDSELNRVQRPIAGLFKLIQKSENAEIKAIS